MLRMSMDEAVSTFGGVRPRLFGIAYRMLGSVTEAEDVVQDAWLRWQGTDRTQVRDAVAFLSTVTTRLALNVAQSARSRRESYLGPWIPEPIDTSHDPHLGAERGEALELAVLMLLEKLTPTERAAYVLREAFGYPYSEIAGIVQVEEANARQLVSRARRHLAAERRTQVTPAEQRRFVEVFAAAASRGDLAALESMLAEDVVTWSDGGGIVSAARKPVRGRERVAQFIAGITSKFATGAAPRWIDANGSSALAFERDAVTFAVATLDVSESGIDRILIVLNPEKLMGLA
jgi:RNA polymerase sigma-70 factor (ECF subfamily)